ncbi:extracellular serine-rich protein [Thozetella sp. PMI_491]|nr:extracellular serine-rich protein [Thozetella sp. PMI_491]
MLFSIAAGLLSAATVVMAVPTPTAGDYQTPTYTLTGVTHTVVAGAGGKLVYDPERTVANIGDIVEWKFLPKNHSVVQSSFDSPCVPQAGKAFFSEFQFVPDGQPEGPRLFQIVVDTKDPIWFYCAQTTGNHCQSGMVGVINEPRDPAKSLDAFKAKAAGTGVSKALPALKGGILLPNPDVNY